MCCNSWGRKESEMTERLNLTELIERRQVNVRVWVIAGTCSLLPVLNDLGIQNKQTNKKAISLAFFILK